jgi:hypothetical protein
MTTLRNPRSASVHVRMEPDKLTVIERAAEQERRSPASLIYNLVTDYVAACESQNMRRTS